MSRKIGNGPPRRSTLSSIMTLLSGTVVAQLIGIAAMPALARIYGANAFGVFAIFLSSSAIVATIAALRYELAIVLPESHEEARTLRQLAFVIVAVLSIITVATTITVFYLTGAHQRNWWILLIGLSVFFAGATNTLFFWLTRGRRYRAQSASRVAQAVATAASQALLGVVIAPTGEWLIVGYIIGQVFGLLTLAFGRERGAAFRPNPRAWWEVMVRYRKMPLFNAPNALIDSLRLNGINVIIASQSLQSLGQFSTAWKLTSGPTSLLASAISQVYFPNMAEAAPGTLYFLVRKITVRALLAGLLPMLALALLAPVAVPWYLGPGWPQAGQIVQALCPWMYLMIATSPLSTVFIVTGRQGTMLAFAIAYLLVPLTVLFLSPIDIVAAVWRLSAAMSVLLVALILLTLSVAKRHDAAGAAD